jgi:hypothetical protein
LFFEAAAKQRRQETNLMALQSVDKERDVSDRCTFPDLEVPKYLMEDPRSVNQVKMLSNFFVRNLLILVIS